MKLLNKSQGKASNNIWAVGDMHFSYLADVFRFDYLGKDLFSYRPQAAVERYGVEFMPGFWQSGQHGRESRRAAGSLLQASFLSVPPGRTSDRLCAPACQSTVPTLRRL